MVMIGLTGCVGSCCLMSVPTQERDALFHPLRVHKPNQKSQSLASLWLNTWYIVHLLVYNFLTTVVIYIYLYIYIHIFLGATGLLGAYFRVGFAPAGCIVVVVATLMPLSTLSLLMTRNKILLYLMLIVIHPLL